MESLKNYTAIIIEDDRVLCENMAKLLQLYFGGVHCFYDAKSALEYLEYSDVLFVLTDIELPCMNGLELAEQIKKLDSDIEVAIITSFVTVEYLKKAVGIGLLDYIEKPITLEKLKSTLEKCTSKIEVSTKERYVIEPNIVVEMTKMELYLFGSTVKLSKKEAQLLEALLKNRGEVISQDRLIAEIWDEDEGTRRALRNLVLRTRKKFGERNIIKSHLYNGYYIE